MSTASPSLNRAQKNKVGKPLCEEYRCTRCSYIYTQNDGDPTADIPQGTHWEKLPDDWACPHCGIDKLQFEPILANDE